MEQTRTINEMRAEEITLIKGVGRAKGTTEPYCIIPLGLRKQPTRALELDTPCSYSMTYHRRNFGLRVYHVRMYARANKVPAGRALPNLRFCNFEYL